MQAQLHLQDIKHPVSVARMVMEETKHVMLVGEGAKEFAKSKGNDLITPAPQFNFPGLKPGDRWCVCARTWLDAVNHGVACPVNLEATHEESLRIIPLELLEMHAE